VCTAESNSHNAKQRTSHKAIVALSRTRKSVFVLEKNI